MAGYHQLWMGSRPPGLSAAVAAVGSVAFGWWFTALVLSGFTFSNVPAARPGIAHITPLKSHRSGYRDASVDFLDPDTPIGCDMMKTIVTCEEAKRSGYGYGWTDHQPREVLSYAACSEGGVFFLRSGTTSKKFKDNETYSSCLANHNCFALCNHTTCKGDSNDIETFIDSVLPVMKGKFVLVTAVGDNSFPDSAVNAQKLLDSPLLIKWYTQNIGTPHPKVAPMPIGYFWYRRDPWSPDKHSKAFPERNKGPRKGVLQDAMNMKTHGSRWTMKREAERCLGDDLVQGKNIDKYKTNQMEMVMSRYNNYTFGLSPRGNGYDSYRTWEMLTMGMIPIIPSTPVDSLFENLPVHIVNDWSELCDINLEHLERDLRPRFENLESKMKLSHFVDSGVLGRAATAAALQRNRTRDSLNAVNVELVANKSRCGNMPWLGVQASIHDCKALVRTLSLIPVLEADTVPCSGEVMVFANDNNCACAPAHQKCSTVDTGLVGSHRSAVYRLIDQRWNRRLD